MKGKMFFGGVGAEGGMNETIYLLDKLKRQN